MDSGLLIIAGLTFVIHLIGTLAYAVRIAGTRTRRVALSLSLFNILILLSRTSNTFQAPLLAKRVENNLSRAMSGLTDFRWLLLCATAGTIAGAFLIPSAQRLLSIWVSFASNARSTRGILKRALSLPSLGQAYSSVTLPRWSNISNARNGDHIPWSVTAANTLSMAVWSVGVFAALYAGYLRPEIRVTASQMSAVVNGVATILMFTFIDPYLALLTDDVVAGRLNEAYFRRSIVWLTGSRLAGTVLAQAILVPAAMWIAFLADRI
jgi:hypothetical protein